MKTYPDINKEGELTSFEIDSWRSGPRLLARLVEKQLGAKVTNRRKWFSNNDVHFQFKFLNHDFLLWEPFGDNSRYTVCPAEGSKGDSQVIAKIQEGFREFRPGFIGLCTGFFGI